MSDSKPLSSIAAAAKEDETQKLGTYRRRAFPTATVTCGNLWKVKTFSLPAPVTPLRPQKIRAVLKRLHDPLDCECFKLWVKNKLTPSYLRTWTEWPSHCLKKWPNTLPTSRIGSGTWCAGRQSKAKRTILRDESR